MNDKDIAEWKIRHRGLCLALNQDFAQRTGFKPVVLNRGSWLSFFRLSLTL